MDDTTPLPTNYGPLFLRGRERCLLGGSSERYELQPFGACNDSPIVSNSTGSDVPINRRNWLPSSSEVGEQDFYSKEGAPDIDGSNKI